MIKFLICHILTFMIFKQLFKKIGMLSVMSDNDRAVITKPTCLPADRIT